MIITFLKDTSTNNIDGVFTSYETSSREIEEIIFSVKTENPTDWSIEDIISNLPKDCRFCCLDNSNNVIYY